MTNPWVSRLGGFLAVLLLATGLALLQVLIGGKTLAYCLPSYAMIAIAGLIAVAMWRANSTADRLCLCATGLFSAYIAIRALASPAPYFARPDLYSVLAALTVYGLTVTTLNGSTRRSALIISLLAFAIFHVFIGLVQFGLGENFALPASLRTVVGLHRASGLYLNPNHLAGLLEILGIFGLSITCWSRLPGWSRVIFGYLAAICYLGLAMTGSRGGYLSTAASLVVFGVLSLVALRSAGPTPLLKFGAAGLIALAVAFVAAALFIQQNMYVSGHVGTVVTTDKTRVDLWRASIAQWKLQPLTGTGSGTYRFYGRQFRAERMQHDPVHVHNDYLHLLCEYGLAGVAGFLFFISAHLRHGWRSFVRLGPRRLAAGSSFLSNRLALNIGALCAIAAYIVHSVVDFNLHIPANALLLAFAFGVVANPGLNAGAEVPSPRQSLVLRFSVLVLAVILLVQSVRLFPGEYYAERARTTLEDEDPSKAVAFAREALNYERQNPTVFFYLGRGLIALGNQQRRTEERIPYYENALSAFWEGQRLTPLDGTYAVELASTYDGMGRFTEAEWMYGVAQSRDPRSIAIAQLYQAHLEAWSKAHHEPD